MPNVNAPRGLVPLRKLGGGTISQTAYSIDPTYATAIFKGDAVSGTGTGRNIAKSAAGATANCGVFVGCSYTDATGKPVWSKHWPGIADGKKDIVAHVVDDPDVIFEIQADSCAAAEVGLMCDWNTGTGNTASGLSGAYAVLGGTVAVAGGSLKVLGLVNRPDNEYGAYAKIEVLLIEHVNRGVIAGVGGV